MFIVTRPDNKWSRSLIIADTVVFTADHFYSGNPIYN